MFGSLRYIHGHFLSAHIVFEQCSVAAGGKGIFWEVGILTAPHILVIVIVFRNEFADSLF